MAEISFPKQQQQGSIGRRLFAQAAPLIGGAAFGPAGAAIGGLVGSKISGGSTQDSLLTGIKAGVSANANPAQSPAGEIVGEGAGGAFSRRNQALSQDPKVAIAEGLNILKDPNISQDIRNELAPALVRADMQKTNNMFGLKRGF